MQLYPAIDMKDGACVRLTQGLFDKVKVYSDSPADMAKLDALNTNTDHQDIWSYKRQQMY